MSKRAKPRVSHKDETKDATPPAGFVYIRRHPGTNPSPTSPWGASPRPAGELNKLVEAATHEIGYLWDPLTLATLRDY